MSRRTSGKGSSGRKQASGRRRAPGTQRPEAGAGAAAEAGGDRPTGTEGNAPDRTASDLNPSDRSASDLNEALDVLATHPMLATMPHCGSCGSPVRWMLPEELKDADREAYRKVIAGLAPEVVERSDVWWCPACGAVGIEDHGDDPYAAEDEAFDSIDLDDRCVDCGTEVEWYDPAYVATIDKDAYMQAKRLFGAADLLDGEAAVCPGCGRITFFPYQEGDD
ncbi:hypothetical protein GA0111570_102232 [Raineyella antarctica]|uniref:Uncharacterized protein n=1 Tax=Raineyella antarctica TaxID=1577474 RepID=A0A1G6GEK5_9ACTN|nr:hypothetical protein [Raineyella antarctica]SDB80442.1 hypothetical protein GA0111570_102232 [Raineyella antarctica]